MKKKYASFNQILLLCLMTGKKPKIWSPFIKSDQNDESQHVTEFYTRLFEAQHFLIFIINYIMKRS